MSSRHSVIPAVWVFFKNPEDEVLLIRRHNTGWRDGWFTLPAGHVEAMEPPMDCAIRESEEEVDLLISREDLILSHTVYYVADQKDHERVSFFFTANTYKGIAKNNEPHKADQLIWVAIDKLPPKTLPIIKHVAEQIEHGSTYSELDYPTTDTLFWNESE